ncbi:MAG TPA: xanthine dehydrogenase family protein subunit M [Actinomycetospora sp.]|uniref:FAD binding domain-containing protein n=1 Tax=Actinomycetospora sp. TaxID=1872135 RepID=UPI002F3E5951
MKPVPFDLLRPRTLDEAVALLAEDPDDSKVLAGGQSLVPLLNFRLARPARLIDLSLLTELITHAHHDGYARLGAMVRQARAEHSPDLAHDVPLLTEALPNIAHPPIRARGTVGGNLAHADPASELPAVATALDAVFVAVGPRGAREIPAAAFFRSHFLSDLADDEILTEVRFPICPGSTGAAFLEVGRRRGDYALVGVGVQVTRDGPRIVDVRVAVTGVAQTPFRAVDVEELLRGRPLDDEGLAAAAESLRATINPGTDLHATADHRRYVAGTLLTRALHAADRRADDARLAA